MASYDLTVKFIGPDNASAGFASKAFGDLLELKGVESGSIPNAQTQDPGTIIGIILGSAAIVEIARGIADVIRRYGVSDIEVVGKSKTVKISNVPTHRLDELVEKISSVVE